MYELVNDYDGTVNTYRSNNREKLQEKMRSLMLENAKEIGNRELTDRITAYRFNQQPVDEDCTNGTDWQIGPIEAYIDNDSYYILDSDNIHELDKEEEYEKEIGDILKKLDGCGSFERVEVNTTFGNEYGIVLKIEGDWKHAHGYADHLFKEAGYSCREDDIEDNGSDWYLSYHTYRKKMQ